MAGTGWCYTVIQYTLMLRCYSSTLVHNSVMLRHYVTCLYWPLLGSIQFRYCYSLKRFFMTRIRKKKLFLWYGIKLGKRIWSFTSPSKLATLSQMSQYCYNALGNERTLILLFVESTTFFNPPLVPPLVESTEIG